MQHHMEAEAYSAKHSYWKILVWICRKSGLPSSKLDGTLKPRLPPKKVAKEQPFNSSFVDEAKRNNRGVSLESRADRVVFEVSEIGNPGPNYYDPVPPVGNPTKSSLMAMAPCKRMTDCLLEDELKKGTPGPGAYEMQRIDSFKAPRIGQQELTERAEVKRSSYISSIMSENPGPGSYYPGDYVSKSLINKLLPFGSTTARFETPKMDKTPSVGSYEINRVFII
jgi:hypothetical protein